MRLSSVINVVKYSSFTTPLILRDNEDGLTFTVEESFEYKLGALSNNIDIKVPKGFVTDLASVPGICWFFVPKLGKYNKAAVLHDYLYQMVREDKFSRAIADAIFLEGMEVMEVPCWKRYPMYLMVRVFGFFAVR